MVSISTWASRITDSQLSMVQYTGLAERAWLMNLQLMMRSVFLQPWSVCVTDTVRSNIILGVTSRFDATMKAAIVITPEAGAPTQNALTNWQLF